MHLSRQLLVGIGRLSRGGWIVVVAELDSSVRVISFHLLARPLAERAPPVGVDDQRFSSAIRHNRLLDAKSGWFGQRGSYFGCDWRAEETKSATQSPRRQHEGPLCNPVSFVVRFLIAM